MDLSGNNFDSLPDSIGGLSSLRYLYLSGNNFDSLPKWLQSFLELPFSLNFAYARFYNLLVLFNGFKLVDHIQSGFFYLAFGSNIPKWFNNQRIGHKVNIQVPSCYGRDERMGIALCIVLVPHCALYAGDFGITCSFEVNGYQMKYTHLCWENCGKIESHQLGLQYLSHYRLSNGFDSDWKEVWSQSDANGICQIGIEISSSNLGVKKIGVRLVFEQEVGDPDQLWRDNSESRESDMDGYNDQPRRDNSECRYKRRRDEEDGAAPSGEAYPNNEPHPKTWRMYG